MDTIRSAADGMSVEPSDSGVGSMGFDIGTQSGSGVVRGAIDDIADPSTSGDAGLPMTMTVSIDEGDASMKSAVDNTFSQ